MEGANAEAHVLQIHPYGFRADSVAQWEQLVEKLVAHPQYRFETAIGFWRWKNDAPNLRIRKISDVAYEIDASAAAYSH